MTITIKLKTDNAAFTDGHYPEETRNAEIRRIIHEWMHKGYMADADLRDSNGNTVGTVTVTGK